MKPFPDLRRLLSPRRAPAARLPETLDLGTGSIALLVRRNPRARRLTMRLAPGGGALSVTVPPRTSDAAILAFVERHRGWAEARMAAVPGRIRVEDGAILPFRGATLAILHDPARRAARLETGSEGAMLLVGGDAAHLPRRVMDALRREARADLQARVDRHAAAVGLKPAALTLKDTRSRWGSCTADRRLAFSWRIVMAPPSVLDYLCAHEVAHFREMNHGPAFWALCRALCPDMDAGRDWLKRHGAQLHAVDFGEAG
ncbi:MULTISPECIES: M48 family metallopeptidase [unclassified Aureimonas]|uniref:M48 family metallopeptidase n=1 Tax=unclassified Aureimonas TaxID=2615206 RepID=UPI0006FA60F8|nr:MULTISPECIES: SprT family zinc-dependent metalloprotease [unclassified Aureimonas]KQT64401.1 metal-dependent hydrolase [Aureimonas sp. Leaf427]KQT81591.1 metal-dependent hydrolase [Aureimonas sp. Leaf460]